MPHAEEPSMLQAILVSAPAGWWNGESDHSYSVMMARTTHDQSRTRSTGRWRFPPLQPKSQRR